MVTINKPLFRLLALYSCLYCSCQYYDLAPYRDEPFAVERFVVFDSIEATYGSHDSPKHPEDVWTNYFLVTGYGDTLAAERKIDSMLLSLINPEYLDMRTYRMYFFKKARKYNNDYARVNREL